MKKKLLLLLATTIFSLMSMSSVFAHDLIIEGEEKTGKKYPTETNYYLDSDENGNEVKTNVTVHLIPKNERFRVSEKDYKDGKGVAIYYVVFGNRDSTSSSDEYNGGSSAVLNDYLDSLWYEPGVYYDFTSSQQIMDFATNGLTNHETGLFPVVFEEYSEYEWTMGKLNPYIFKLVDAPLLTDNEEIPEEKPTSTDSNANKPSGGGSSSGGSSSSSKKSSSSSANNSIAGTWKQDVNGWWFEKAGGGYPQNEWIQKDNIWYHFNENGYMQTGWLELNGIKYFLNPDGSMVSNDWSCQNGKWYFFDQNGAMKKGWQEWKAKWYYMSDNGEMLFNVTTPDGYKVDQTGAMINS